MTQYDVTIAAQAQQLPTASSSFATVVSTVQAFVTLTPSNEGLQAPGASATGGGGGLALSWVLVIVLSVALSAVVVWLLVRCYFSYRPSRSLRPRTQQFQMSRQGPSKFRSSMYGEGGALPSPEGVFGRSRKARVPLGRRRERSWYGAGFE